MSIPVSDAKTHMSEESIHILHARNNYASEEQWAVNEIFVRHHSNYDLAKHIVLDG